MDATLTSNGAATTTTRSSDFVRLGDEAVEFKIRLSASAIAAKARESERIAELKARGVSCLRCADTGNEGYCDCSVGTAIREEREREDRARGYRELPRFLHVPARFETFSFDTFPEQDSATLRAVREWSAAEHDPNVPGLFLYGGFGRGKTGMIVAALRDLVWRKVERNAGYERWYEHRFDRIGRFVTGTGFLESLRPHAGVDDSADMIREYQQAEYLAFDDLGAERLTEWGIDRLFEVVNYRHSHLKAMLVTSNLSPGELAKRINRQIGDQSGDRIVERLMESCTVIHFDDREPNLRIGGTR